MHPLNISEIKAAVGGNKKLADLCGVSPQAVSQWQKVPVSYVLKLEKITLFKLSRHAMRIDVYPAEHCCCPVCRREVHTI